MMRKVEDCAVTLTNEDGWVVAEALELPGCISQGKTEVEALANIREAITAWHWAESLNDTDSEG